MKNRLIILQTINENTEPSTQQINAINRLSEPKIRYTSLPREPMARKMPTSRFL